MSSPVEEVAHTPILSTETDVSAAIEADAAAFGPDEEHLVQMAQREAMLRLARAM